MTSDAFLMSVGFYVTWSSKNSKKLLIKKKKKKKNLRLAWNMKFPYMHLMNENFYFSQSLLKCVLNYEIK